MPKNTLDLRTPQPEPPAQASKARRWPRIRRWQYAVAAGLFLFAGGAASFWYYHTSIPRSVRHGVDFTLYYPKQLPAGYKVDPASFKNQDGVVIFSITAPGGRNIGVSEQGVPLNLALRPTNNAPLTIPGEKDFSTPIGKAHVGLWGDKYVADIITDDTWIILNVGGFTADDATLVAQSFRRL